MYSKILVTAFTECTSLLLCRHRGVVDAAARGADDVDGAGLDPSCYEPLQQAHQLQAAGDWLSAAAIYAELACRHPDDHRLLANQGNALWLADLPAAAHLAYSRALALNPQCLVSRRGLASCLRDLNCFDQALAVHRLLEPIFPHRSEEGLANLWAHSQVLIGLERFGEAFTRMASRRAWAAGRMPTPWNALAAQITLVSEQGFGDSLQFVRFLLPLLRRRAAAGLRNGVRLMVEPALVDCFREGLAWLETPPQVDPLSPDDSTQDALTLLELPGALGLQQLPQIRGDGAYLTSPRWVGGGAGRPLQLGLVSAAGHPGADPFCIREFQKRTLPMPILWRLVDALRQSGAQVYDLQFGADACRHRALGLSPLPSGAGLDGFAATARAVAQLDLVISVDTAMAHLMGAMGRFGWVLLPWSADPRWLSAGPLSPWYPRLRLFRQPRPGDWHGAVDQLLDTFKSGHFAAGKAP